MGSPDFLSECRRVGCRRHALRRRPRNVVAIMLQPTYGGKAYWSSRVFTKINNVWQMSESYHNTVMAGPVITVAPPRGRPAGD